MIAKEKENKRWLKDRVKNGRSQPSLIERFKKSEKQKGMVKAGAGASGSLMSKFGAMQAVKETLEKHGIEFPLLYLRDRTLHDHLRHEGSG